MNFQAVVFFTLATVLVLSALRVITARNPVHAVLFLVLSFASAAGLWMLLHAEFLAIALILVYVGAVMVLFLFVVMMLDINIDRLREGFWMILLVAIVAAIALTLRTRKNTRGIDPAVQVAATREGRVRLVPMRSEPKGVSAPPQENAQAEPPQPK